MCSIFDTEDIVPKRPNTNGALKGKHKVCSILDIVYLALSNRRSRGWIRTKHKA